MAKAVRWIVPFQSLKGIQYEVRIYDNYTGTVPTSWPITLQGGATPFETSEDNSEDFFEPVRPSTGTLEVVDMDGTLMEQIIPANNVERPVRLVSIANNTEKVEWQGFLSCEAYTQDYTARAQVISINVNSVLAAMDSEHINESAAGIKTIRYMIKAVLDVMVAKGVTINTIHFPTVGDTLLNKYIDSTVMYEEIEISNENSIRYEAEGKSCKEVLETIVTFAGWCVREKGDDIYITRIGDSGTQSLPYAQFASGGTPIQDTETSKALDTFEWRGDGHTKSISNGAHAVKLTAAIKDYELGLTKPECPYDNLTEVYQQYATSKMIYMLYTLAGYNFITFGTRSWQVMFNISGSQVDTITYDHSNIPTRQEVIDNLVMVALNNAPANKLQNRVTDHDAQVLYAGAFLCKKVFEDYQLGRQIHDVKDALYCAFIPVYSKAYFPSITNPAPVKIFTMSKVLPFAATNGYLRLFSEGDMIGNAIELYGETGIVVLTFQLKFGNYYWDGENNVWTSTAKTVSLEVVGGKILTNWEASMGVEEADGYFIPITMSLYGKVELSLYDQAGMITRMGAYIRTFVAEMAFDELGVDYAPLISNKNNERSENTYYRLIDLNHTDDIEVSTDIATDMNNHASPSVLYENSNNSQKTKFILYGTQSLRPEIDLLNRMATHYGAAKRKLTLQVEHPTEPLPLLRVTDDEKTYIPVSESRDYAADSSELTLHEM